NRGSWPLRLKFAFSPCTKSRPGERFKTVNYGVASTVVFASRVVMNWPFLTWQSASISSKTTFHGRRLAKLTINTFFSHCGTGSFFIVYHRLQGLQGADY